MKLALVPILRKARHWVVAVVDHFRKACGAQVMATTHYSGLKMYAANEAGVLNASVEFNEKTLQPTYRLIVGLAGSSSGPGDRTQIWYSRQRD